MNILHTKKIILLAFVIFEMSMNVACSMVENIAMGLENEIENITETSTTTEAITSVSSIETTTNELNYNTLLTVCPVYEPTITNTEIENGSTFTDGSYIEIENQNTSIDSSYIETQNQHISTDSSYIETQNQYISTDSSYVERENQYTSTGSSYVEAENSYIDGSYLFNNCAFIGDSLTIGLSMYDFIPKEYTFAKEGINLLKINSLQLSTSCGYVYPAQAISGWQSKHVYILLGINGVTWISEDNSISHYTQLVNDILTYNPNVEDINIISVLPVAYSMETKSSVEEGRILNSEIDSFNLRLQSMAYDLGLNYIDVNSRLKNSYGCLPDDLTIDGLHLTQSGYEKVRNILIEYAQTNVN